MELLKIILFLAAAAAVLYGYIYAMAALNRRCMKKYRYEPVTFTNFGLIIAACGVFFLGALMGDANVYVAIVLALAVVLGIWGWIYSKTSFLDSLAAMSLLLVGGIFVFLVLLAIWLNSGGRRGNRR
jgi:hypothetical protein